MFLIAPVRNRNRKLEISIGPTKAKLREPAYSQALIQNKVDRRQARSRELGRQTERRLWWMVFKTGRKVGRRPKQQNINEMNGAHLASPVRGELGYAHWPQLGTQFIALLGTQFGAHQVNKMFALTLP